MPADPACTGSAHARLNPVPKIQLDREFSGRHFKPFEHAWADFVPVNSQPIFHPAGDLLDNRDLIFSYGAEVGDKRGL
jgi:hypothetical protein